MNKILFSLVLIFILNACVATTPAIPPDYVGPLATIEETAVRVDSGKAQMFFLREINGKYFSENSSSRSFSESYGHGNNLTIIDSPYEIPAKEQMFTIEGSHVWAMDGRALFEDSLSVKGEVKFSPVAGRTYLINGSLSEDKSMVWIKDTETGEIIAEFVNDNP
jgi:hypothetical protein